MDAQPIDRSGAKSDGLKPRYQVRRADGRIDDGADYFVLRLDQGDKHALAGGEAYAKSCEAELPALASDLRAKIRKYKKGSIINLD